MCQVSGVSFQVAKMPPNLHSLIFGIYKTNCLFRIWIDIESPKLKYSNKETLYLSTCAEIFTNTKKKKGIIGHISCVMCHLSRTCHLTITLCSFILYESPRMFDKAAVGGLVNEKTIKNMFQEFFFITIRAIQERNIWLEVFIPLQYKVKPRGPWQMTRTKGHCKKNVRLCP